MAAAGTSGSTGKKGGTKIKGQTAAGKRKGKSSYQAPDYSSLPF